MAWSPSSGGGGPFEVLLHRAVVDDVELAEGLPEPLPGGVHRAAREAPLEALEPGTEVGDVALLVAQDGADHGLRPGIPRERVEVGLELSGGVALGDVGRDGEL